MKTDQSTRYVVGTGDIDTRVPVEFQAKYTSIRVIDLGQNYMIVAEWTGIARYNCPQTCMRQAVELASALNVESSLEDR